MDSATTRLHRVSVIIPVFNDSTRLSECLDAVAQQDYPSHLIEIVVVDNGSEDNLKQIVETDRVRIVKEEMASSYAARNAGVLSSHGEILAFTDSDCLPCSNWIRSGVDALTRNSLSSFVAGQVVLFHQQQSPRTAVELFESTIGNPFLQGILISQHNFGVTANLFVWRSVMDQVGLFESRLKSAGDWEWGNRAKQKGYRGFYAADAIVQHPSGRSKRQHWRRCARYAGGDFDAAKIRGMLTLWWVICECWRDLALQAAPICLFHEGVLPSNSFKRALFWLPLSGLPYVWHHIQLRSLRSGDRLKVLCILMIHNCALVVERVKLSFGSVSLRS